MMTVDHVVIAADRVAENIKADIALLQEDRDSTSDLAASVLGRIAKAFEDFAQEIREWGVDDD